MSSKRPTVEARLETLNTLNPASDPEAQQQIASALADKHYRIVAKAAALCGEAQLFTCEADLLAAYRRFLRDPVKRDPNCLAKAAIAHALVELDCLDAAFFLEGLTYRQMEPVWGGSVDTAIDVRCQCAMGLVASGYPRALPELTVLLNDEEAPARLGAVRAIACGQPREAELLLRFKALSGDPEPAVTGECLSALLSVEPDESPDFVASFLQAEDETVQELAALALGESRLEAALPLLQSAWDDILLDRGFKRVLIRAAAMHRSQGAFDWLVAMVAQEHDALATEVLEALSTYRNNTRLADQLGQALAERDDPELTAQFQRLWPPSP